METKPFDLQSPEQIAKDYMGNKQKIAAAAQAGTLDPTAAVMAGMFIDRMRSAQMQEQVSPSTVAQDVLAPQVGLGVPPPGMLPPQMGAPPPMGMPMAPPPMAPPPMQPNGPPMGAPPVGMAGGGMVAFAHGELVPPAPLYGLSEDPQANMRRRDALYSPETAERAAMQRYWREQASPENQARGRKEDMWTALAQIGFGMAGSNSPNFLQSAGQAATAAMPGMAEAKRARKAETRQGLAALADMEGMSNAEKQRVVEGALTDSGNFANLSEGRRTAAERMAHDLAMQDDAQAFTAGQGALNRAAARSGGGGGGGGVRASAEVQALFNRLRRRTTGGWERLSNEQLLDYAYTQVGQRRRAASADTGDGFDPMAAEGQGSRVGLEKKK